MTIPTGWRKSSYSPSAAADCVEVADLPGGGRAVRDSKNPDRGYFTFSAKGWQAFVDGVKNGEFDA